MKVEFRSWFLVFLLRFIFTFELNTVTITFRARVDQTPTPRRGVPRQVITIPLGAQLAEGLSNLRRLANQRDPDRTKRPNRFRGVGRTMLSVTSVVGQH